MTDTLEIREIEGTIEIPYDEEILAELKTAIEALSQGVTMYGRTAYTARRTPYAAFGNGAQRDEMTAPTYPTEDLRELVAMHLIAITAYRQTLNGPVDLVWRCEPEVRIVEGGKPMLYSRLAFEPTITQVANSVWVEEMLTIDGWGN